MFSFLSIFSVFKNLSLKNIAIILAVIAVGFFLYQVHNIKKDNDILKADLIKSELKYTLLTDQLKQANLKIETNEKKYAEWEKQKPEVKYKVIYKFKEDTKNATCEEKVLSLSNIDFNDL